MCPLLGLWWWNWSTITVATTDIATITMVLAKYWPENDRRERLLTICMLWTMSVSLKTTKTDTRIYIHGKKLTYQGYRVWSGGHNLCNHQHEDSQRKQNRDAWRQTQDTMEQRVGCKEKEEKSLGEESTCVNSVEQYISYVAFEFSSRLSDSPRKSHSILVFLIFPPAFSVFAFSLSLLPSISAFLTPQ